MLACSSWEGISVTDWQCVREHIFTQQGSWFCGMQQNPDRQARCCVRAGLCCRLLTQDTTCCVPATSELWGTGLRVRPGVTDFQWKSWGAGSCWFVMMALSVLLLNALNWCPTLKLLGNLHLIFCIWRGVISKKPLFFHGPLWKHQTATN